MVSKTQISSTRSALNTGLNYCCRLKSLSLDCKWDVNQTVTLLQEPVIKIDCAESVPENHGADSTTILRQFLKVKFVKIKNQVNVFTLYIVVGTKSNFTEFQSWTKQICNSFYNWITIISR